jgi:hypothetical protein
VKRNLHVWFIVTAMVLSLTAASCLPFIPVEPVPSPTPTPSPEPPPTVNEPPIAYIDSISPSEAIQGESITFQGHGTDQDGTVVAYRWTSDRDGDLGTTASFQSSSLSVGEHEISLIVQDNNGEWSETVNATVEVVVPPPPPAADPDLVITDIYKIETSQGFIIGYTIENQGDCDAEGTTSALYANGDLEATASVPALSSGESIDRSFDDWIFNPVTPEIEVVADIDDNAAEADEDNNEEQASLLDVIFDFVDEAENVDWKGGPPQESVGFGTDGSEGFARYVTDQELEDGSGPMKVLETHPKWVDDGWISGTYLQLYSSEYTVEAGEHFFARVGFLEGAGAGNVDFRIMIRPEGGPNTWIAIENKDYGTPLKTIDVPLDDFVGKRADFILRVTANGSSAQDWAVWVEAKIIR